MEHSRTFLIEDRKLTVLRYIRDNPGCTSTDLYRNISTNPSLNTCLRTLVSEGLVQVNRRGDSNAHYHVLTSRGERFMVHIDRAEAVLRE